MSKSTTTTTTTCTADKEKASVKDRVKHAVDTMMGKKPKETKETKEIKETKEVQTAPKPVVSEKKEVTEEKEITKGAGKKEVTEKKETTKGGGIETKKKTVKETEYPKYEKGTVKRDFGEEEYHSHHHHHHHHHGNTSTLACDDVLAKEGDISHQTIAHEHTLGKGQAILVCEPHVHEGVVSKGEHKHSTEHHHETLYKEGTREYTRGDGTVVIEHVHPIEHQIERVPVMEETQKRTVVHQRVHPEEVTEVHRHIHPVERQVVKEYIHPKETTEVHEKVHEYKTREVHEHVHPVIEREVRQDVYLPEQRRVEEKSIERGEVSRTKVTAESLKGDVPRDAKVFEHVHPTEHKVDRVPLMQPVEMATEVKREVIPEERVVVHRHVHPVAIDVVKEHVHPKEVTEVVEHVHEKRTREIHEHVKQEEVSEVRKDTYLPEKRTIKEKYIDHGEVGRERVDVDLGHQQGVLVKDVPGVAHVHHHEHNVLPKPEVIPKEPKKEKKIEKKEEPKPPSKIHVDVVYDVDKEGNVKSRDVHAHGHNLPSDTKPTVEVDTKIKKGTH